MTTAKTISKDVPGVAIGNQQPDQSLDFAQGETVMANHNGRLYEAKVLLVEGSEDEKKYRIHYLGWNRSWDEWVEKGRLMKCNKEDTLPDDKQEAELNNNKSGPPLQAMPKTSTGGRSKKRKVDSGIEENDTVPTSKRVKIPIPLTLKKQLTTDCDFVNHLGKLVKLPRVPCVDDILKKYLDHKSNKDSVIPDSIVETLNGLRSYFDKALSLFLLYKEELQQYQKSIVDGTSPSTIYGAEHLLRLFVKLPSLLASANIDDEALNPLLPVLHDFLKFMVKNQSTFFVSSYELSINEVEG